MNMWPEITNLKIEPLAPKPIPDRPKRCRKKAKDEPKKKYGKLSRKWVKMTCSKCHQQGHNRRVCKVGIGMPSQQNRDFEQPASSSQAASPNLKHLLLFMLIV